MDNILVASIHRALFRPYFIALTSTTECDYRLRVGRDRHIILDVEHIRERVDMV